MDNRKTYALSELQHYVEVDYANLLQFKVT